MNLQILSTYIIACIFIICTPGPSVTYLITTSISKGKISAYRTIPGIFLGDLSAMILSFAGVGLLIINFPVFYNLFKLFGIAYLIYLGLKSIFRKIENSNNQEKSAQKNWKTGFLLTFSNPKTILFFSSFIPQFISPHSDYLFQVALLGGIYLVIGLVNDFTYSTFAFYVGKLLGENASYVAAKIGGLAMIISAILVLFEHN